MDLSEILNEGEELLIDAKLWTSPTNSQHLIIAGFVRRNRKKMYIVNCNICSADPEVYGDGYFISSASNLSQGKGPCGCSKMHNYNKKEYVALLKRAAGEMGQEFVCFKGWYNGTKTPCIVECGRHGLFSVTRADRIIERRLSCRQCFSEYQAEGATIADEDHVSRFMLSGQFAEGTVFERTNSVDYWKVWCPVCDMSYTAKPAKLRKGRSKCRCSPFYQMTEEDYLEGILKQCGINGYEFLGWVEGYHQKGKTKLRLNCNLHGVWETTTAISLIGDHGCKACGQSCPEFAYIHIVKDGDVLRCIKVGVTIDIDRRLWTQNNRNYLTLERYGAWKFEKYQDCLKAEKEALQLRTSRLVTKDEMPDGYTETLPLSKIDEVIEIYERNGGTRID